MLSKAGTLATRLAQQLLVWVLVEAIDLRYQRRGFHKFAVNAG
jgi:hypothetical protein